MNRQEIYNTARDGLLTQGQRSTAGGQMCLYRGPGGLKCGLGFLIPDENYDEKMEGGNVQVLITQKKKGEITLPDFFNKENENFLALIQQIHDDQDPEDWRSALVALALNYGLVP